MDKTRWLLTFGALSFSLLFLAAACGGEEENPFSVKSELVTAADRPIALAFAPDGRLFYAEHLTGNIRVVSPDGQLQGDPFAKVEVALFIEWGLTGLALDPDFENNHYVYAFLTEAVSPEGPVGRPVVVRFTDQDNRGLDPEVIVGDLPETNPKRPGFNANGSIHFGPDGFLYITIGDYDRGKTIGPNGKPFAQDLSTPLGKMLRINKENGAAPPDNPFFDQPDADPRIFAYGFSRPFNFAFHPQNGQIYGHDNTASCEELNLIKAGGNYGWPDVGDFPWPDCTAGEQIEGIHFLAIEGKKPGDFLSGPGVTGMETASGDVYPLLGDSLLVCTNAKKLMRRLVLSGAGLDQVTDDDVVVKDCDMDIAVSPDGIVYYSNQTEIRRLVPVESE